MSNKVINAEEPQARELACKILGSEAESHGTWRFIRMKLEDDPRYSNQLGLFAIASHGDIVIRDSYTCASGYKISEKYWRFPLNPTQDSYYTFSTSIFPEVNLHRIVAHTFLPEWDPDLVVNHIDGVKTNNNIDNLEMCTLAENTAHFRNAECFAEIRKQHDINCTKHFIGTHHSEEVRLKISESNKGHFKSMEFKQNHSKFMKAYYENNNCPSCVSIKCIETGESFSTIDECCKQFGVSFATLTSHISNPDKPSKKLVGYHFEYLGRRKSKQASDKMAMIHKDRIWVSNPITHDRKLIYLSDMDKYTTLGYIRGKIK